MEPRTIEELRQWYIGHNLPPENVTRFFVGKNIREPKAFGIYEEDGIFTVYKNKDTGERVIRYQGPNEAKAVSELLERLKKEILHQKSLNGKGTDSYHENNSIQGWKLCLLVIGSIVLFFGFLIALSVHISREDAMEPNSWRYYYKDDNNFYYYDGYNARRDEQSSYQWYKYSFADDDWYRDVEFSSEDKHSFPDGISAETPNGYLSDLEQFLGSDYDKYRIQNYRNYIDDGHHYIPDEGYYQVGEEIYYYMDDDWGLYYGNGDTSGWYYYDYDYDDWNYVSRYDNKSAVEEELWYDADSYYAGSSSNSVEYDYGGLYEGFQEFETTDWYQQMQQAEQAHAEEKASREESNSNSDNSWFSSNDDYTWDSGDSWSSDSTDWSSDW